MHRVLSDFRTLVFGTLVAALMAAGASAQTLISDQPDYSPGSTAVLTGKGFAPGETVTLQVLHADGAPSGGADHDPWYVDADHAGNFVTTWHVCEDDCVGELLLATADQASGAHAETTFTDTDLGTGRLSSVTPNDGGCVNDDDQPTTAVESWDVQQAKSYHITLTDVTDCANGGSDATIEVIVKSTDNGNQCLTASKTATGQYEFDFTMPSNACNTYPILYCTSDCSPKTGLFARRSDGGSKESHLRAANFDGDCNKIDNDTDCTEGGGCTPCTLECPPSAHVDCSGSTDPSSTGTPTGCASNATFTDDVAPGNCAGNYVITRHWSAPDGCGGTATCDQIITVTDTMPPAIGSAAANKTVECDGTGNTADLAAWLASHGGASASDGCSNVTWSDDFTTLSDGCGATGSATVKFTAKDDCLNAASTTATFTIKDSTPPTINPAAANKTVECDGAGNTADLAAWLASRGGASASDGCSNVTWSDDFTALSDGCGATGSATVKFTAKDDCGNAASTTATFTIKDSLPPTINTAAANKTVECDGAGNTADLAAWLASQGGASASDGCSNVTWSDDFTTLSDGCGATGSATVKFTAKDDCGNAASTMATFTIKDTTAPTNVTCPANYKKVLTGTDSSCCVDDAAIGSATATDGCSGVTIDHNPKGPYCVSAAPVTITWTAKDDCGNESSCTQTVTVLGQICAVKFYDANGNGNQDSGEVGVAGWDMVLTPGNIHKTTNGSGKAFFDVAAGPYTVTEGTPTQSNWFHTTPTTCSVVIDSSTCSATCKFGNFCVSPPTNGLTLGFWSNKNGQAILQAHDTGLVTWRTIINGLGLRTASGGPFTVSTTASFATAFGNFKTWLLGATATNMSYMLSAQLAATTLDVAYNGLSDNTIVIVPGGVKTQANVCIVPFLNVTQSLTSCGTPLLGLTMSPGSTTCGCSSNDGSVTISDLRARAMCLLAAYPSTAAISTAGSSTQRTYQECVKDILDMINNNGNPSGGSAYPCGGLNYVNSVQGSCSASF